MEYHRLGDYIREVNVRNRELKVTRLVGLTIDKAFIPSVANVIGTDLSNYKVIRREQFACSLMQVSRDGKMPVAMFDDDEAIMSPAYPMFEVVDKSKFLPQYLMMWFSRKEFDREASYYAVGGVRGSLEWEDFCNMQLPVPSIERQREIVSEYETLTRRIRLNNQMIEKLEATTELLYTKECVEGKSEDSMPYNWRKYTLKEFAPVITGKKDANIATENGLYKFFTCSKEDYLTDYYSFDAEALLLAGNGDFNVKYFKGKFEAYQRTYVLIPHNNKIIGLLYNAIRYNMSEMSKGARGSVISFLTKDMVENVSFYAPINILNFDDILEKFNNIVRSIYTIKKENEIITKTQSLLLAKMGK